MKIAFILIVIHFIADFICQDEKWAIGKSKNLSDLLKHTMTYSFIWFIPVIILFPDNWKSYNYFLNGSLFVIITFIAHTITDFFTSKLTSSLHRQGKFGSSIPNMGFFTAIGFDQVCHYAQLFLTFHFLNSLVWN